MKTLLAILLLFATPLLAVRLEWNASTGPDVAGYRLKWGFASGAYTHTVEAGMSLTATVEEPWPMGVNVYFAAFAYNTLGIESLPSNEVVYNVPIPTPAPTPTPTPTPPPPTPSPTPAPPSNLKLLLDAIAKWWAERFGQT